MQRENTLHSSAKAHPAHRKGRARRAALLRNHHAFKRLDAFLDLFAFAFLQAHIHLHRIARTKLRQIFAQLRFMQLTNYWIHVPYSLQTHSGGASSSSTIRNYTEKSAHFLARFWS